MRLGSRQPSRQRGIDRARSASHEDQRSPREERRRAKTRERIRVYGGGVSPGFAEARSRRARDGGSVPTRRPHAQLARDGRNRCRLKVIQMEPGSQPRPLPRRHISGVTPAVVLRQPQFRLPLGVAGSRVLVVAQDAQFLAAVDTIARSQLLEIVHTTRREAPAGYSPRTQFVFGWALNQSQPPLFWATMVQT